MKTLRVAHFADSHLNDANLERNLEVHNQLLGKIAAFAPDLIVHAGDMHDIQGAPASVRVRDAAGDILIQLAELAPVILVRGNHDLQNDLRTSYSKLRTTFPVHVQEAWEVLKIRETSSDRPGLIVQCLPWFDKAQLAAGVEVADANKETTDQLAIRAARELLATYRDGSAKARTAGAVTVGVGHVMIGGSIVSSGQTLIGHTVELSPSDLASTGAQLWCLGHIHKCQGWQPAGCAVWYSGSPERLDHGETEEKFWLAHTIAIDDNGRVAVETTQVPTIATRIVQQEITLGQAVAIAEGKADALEDLGNLCGANVRLRYSAEPQDLLPDRELIARRLREVAGARDVKIEPEIRREAAVRSESIARARSEEEALFEWAKASGLTLDDDQVERLKEKVATLLAGRAA